MRRRTLCFEATGSSSDNFLYGSRGTAFIAAAAFIGAGGATLRGMSEGTRNAWNEQSLHNLRSVCRPNTTSMYEQHFVKNAVRQYYLA